jgi:hypothetical protein
MFDDEVAEIIDEVVEEILFDDEVIEIIDEVIDDEHIINVKICYCELHKMHGLKKMKVLKIIL